MSAVSHLRTLQNHASVLPCPRSRPYGRTAGETDHQRDQQSRPMIPMIPSVNYITTWQNAHRSWLIARLMRNQQNKWERGHLHHLSDSILSWCTGFFDRDSAKYM